MGDQFWERRLKRSMPSFNEGGVSGLAMKGTPAASVRNRRRCMKEEFIRSRRAFPALEFRQKLFDFFLFVERGQTDLQIIAGQAVQRLAVRFRAQDLVF